MTEDRLPSEPTDGPVDVHRQPVVPFKGDWQLETCAKASPNTQFVELKGAVFMNVQGR